MATADTVGWMSIAHEVDGERWPPRLTECVGLLARGAVRECRPESWRALGDPVPPAIDPGRAQQTRSLASRSFVQWRVPPGRQEPRPLHGVWVDGRREWELG
jgi:hypothetical protein